MKTDSDQVKRWILPKPINIDEVSNIKFNKIIKKILIRRGLDLKNELDEFIKPSDLPNPEDHFIELAKATKKIIQACERNEQIAICGDYDADGITSTALLVELLTIFGARVKPFIPSRQDEGYGLNLNMINEINDKKIKLIITVDNGISAFDAIRKSKDFGIDLIITDHHKLPDNTLPIYSLIHPEMTPVNSPYKYLAGVGIAYLLARNICNKLNFDIKKTSANVLFCIGTVADMAPLKGANRKWLKECLPEFNTTANKGIKSIIRKLSIEHTDITSQDIGYKIAPLLNAVGRIGDPKLIIDLLTNKSKDSVNYLVEECFAINKERKKLTSLIEREALELAQIDYRLNRRFLVLTNSDWHPGIIGIVAARMVDRFNLPTAILARANDGNFRGSVRSNNRLFVNQSLDECRDLLISYGGHSAAAGFSIKQENIHMLKERLNNIATREFRNIDLDKSLKPESFIRFKDINLDFYRQLNLIGPFGVMNPAPLFWTIKCKVIDIYKLKGGHFKMILNDGTSSINAIKWNGIEEINKNDLIDIAFYIELNKWKKNNSIHLNIVDIKKHKKIVELHVHNRIYKCQLTDNKNVLIKNSYGQCFSSDISISSKNLDKNQTIFAKKILTFAQIALGEAA